MLLQSCTLPRSILLIIFHCSVMVKNSLAWYDINVSNLERAVAFYSKLLDGELKIEAQGGMKFAVLPHEGEEGLAGCLAQVEDFVPCTNGILIYLDVDSRIIDATRIARENGGKVISDIQEVAPWGYMSIILDSEGNKIALHSFSNQ